MRWIDLRFPVLRWLGIVSLFLFPCYVMYLSDLRFPVLRRLGNISLFLFLVMWCISVIYAFQSYGGWVSSHFSFFLVMWCISVIHVRSLKNYSLQYFMGDTPLFTLTFHKWGHTAIENHDSCLFCWFRMHIGICLGDVPFIRRQYTTQVQAWLQTLTILTTAM